jgi:peptidyl-prolyl cis-trans isomerase D
MIELIHKHPLIIKVLLAVVTLTFVVTGGWMLGKEDVANFAAKVGKEKITMTQYQAALDRMHEFYRNLYKGNIPDDVMKRLDLNRRTIEALVDQKLLVDEAKKQGLTATDQELSDAITQNKSFQDASGRFDRSRYTQVLQSNGMTPALYEHQVRDDMIAEKFRDMVKDSVYVTDDELRGFYKAQLAGQKKGFDEKEFQAQKENLRRMLTAAMQEKTVKSFLEGLRKTNNVEISPSILNANS